MMKINGMDRENAPAKNRLTAAERQHLVELHFKTMQARVDAENLELEMRRDFAERRLKKLQGGGA